MMNAIRANAKLPTEEQKTASSFAHLDKTLNVEVFLESWLEAIHLSGLRGPQLNRHNALKIRISPCRL